MERLIKRLTELFGRAAVDDDAVSLGYSDNERDTEMAEGTGGQEPGGGAFDGMGFCG